MSIRLSKSLVIAALVTAGVMSSGSVMARGGDCERDAPRAEKISVMKERHAQRMTGQLDAKSERLALRADQRPAWDNFRKTLTDGRPEAGKLPALARDASVLERVNFLEQQAEVRLEHARKMREATQALYAVLNEEQRKIFDERPARQHDDKKRPAPCG